MEGKPLAGKIAVVAGATRGAGRGIARMLGEAGATVYCTGRSSRGVAATHQHHYAGRPETIEETAEMVTAAGGEGIPVRVDHTVEADVAALFDRVRAERGRLDVLVNVLTGPESPWKPFLEQTTEQGRALLEGWVWPHVLTCRHAAPLMVENRSGLIVEITEGDTLGYSGGVFYDLAVASIKRLAYALAEELAPHGVTAVAVAPGFMRTEAILEHFGATAETWREVAATSAEARGFGFAGSETPCFVGRAVAALAADPHVARWSGGLFGSWTLSDAYGFVDVDGGRPHWGRYGAENFPQYFGPPTARTGRRWAFEAVPRPAEAEPAEPAAAVAS